MKINGAITDNVAHIDAPVHTKLEIQGTVSGIDGELESMPMADPSLVVGSPPTVTRTDGVPVQTSAVESGGLPIWILRNGVKRSVQIVASVADTDRKAALNAIPLRLEKTAGNTITFSGKLPIEKVIKNSEVILLWVEHDPTVAPGTAPTTTAVLKTIPLKIAENSGG